MDVRRINPRNLSVDLLLCGKVLTIISVYKPHSGRSEEDKNCFCDDLSAEVQSKNGNCIVLRDFIGLVGNWIDGYEGVHGKQGWGIRNNDGEIKILRIFKMVVSDTFFKKDSKKLITFRSGVNSSVIVYALVKKELMKRVKDVKVIPGEECFSQHRLLVMNSA